MGEIKDKILEHIKQNANLKGLHLREGNGYNHHIHIHCLVSLNRELSMSKTAQLIKGESSYWINKNKMTIGL